MVLDLILVYDNNNNKAILIEIGDNSTLKIPFRIYNDNGNKENSNKILLKLFVLLLCIWICIE